MSGTVLLVAGPSGSGKTTLVQALVNRVPFLTRAITVTTRLPRLGEVSGEDYHFVSPARFAQMEQAGELIECAEKYTESYGIPRTVLAGLCDRALILTVGGALSLRQRLPYSLSIFIQPASAQIAANRILDRNCPNSGPRISSYEEEIATASQFDRIFLNVNFDKTLDEIEDFYLRARRLKPQSPRASNYDNGRSGRGSANGPELCSPRVQTNAKTGSPCHNCLQGSLGLMADIYPNWFRPYKDVTVGSPRPVKKYCVRAAQGSARLAPAATPNEVPTESSAPDETVRRLA